MEVTGRYKKIEHPTVVDPRGNLNVQSRSIPAGAAYCLDGQAFSFTTNLLSVTTSGGTMLYFEFTNAAKLMAMNVFTIFWNGGSTSFNKPLLATIKAATSAPTANHTEITPSNLNGKSTAESGITVYKWDGVGNGMTGATQVATKRQFPLGLGPNLIPRPSTQIFGKGGSWTIDLNPFGAEAGNATIEIDFYLIDPDKDPEIVNL